MAADSVSLPITGGCNCGAVRYEVAEPLLGANYCHCTRCQRRTGTAAGASAVPKPGAFTLISGEDAVATWNAGDGWDKCFCGTCGSALWARSPEHPEILAIRLGTFDSDPGVRPAVRQFVAYAAPWEPIPDDGLPRFPERAGA
jgi:hypothetical protein